MCRTCFNIYVSCTLRICIQFVSTPRSVLSKMNLNMGHFTLNAVSRKAETCHIELKIKHVSGYISTYVKHVLISTFPAHYEYAFGLCQHYAQF